MDEKIWHIENGKKQYNKICPKCQIGQIVVEIGDVTVDGYEVFISKCPHCEEQTLDYLDFYLNNNS